MKMSRNSDLNEKILNATEGLTSKLVNLTLFLIYFGWEFGTSFDTKNRATYKGLMFANKTLGKVNYQSLKRAIWELKRKGLIKSLRRELITAEKITAEGFKKIQSSIPIYNSQRTWDKRIYLITYDIPNKPVGKRDLLRHFLKSLRCASLQQSVWLTCYNPKKLLQTFIEEQRIPGQILISDLGPDGSVGEKDIKTLLEEVYNLAALNYQYQQFLKRFKNLDKNDKNNQISANFAFLSILQNDPQLPWPLLPDDWLGEKAHSLWQKFKAK